MFKSRFMIFINSWNGITDVKFSLVTLIDPSRPYDTTSTHMVPVSTFLWYSIRLVPISVLVHCQCCDHLVPIFMLIQYLFMCYSSTDIFYYVRPVPVFLFQLCTSGTSSVFAGLAV
jgi:hypothetical protein